MTIDLDTWLTLFGHFLLLSFLSIGGAIVVTSDMHRVMVEKMGLLNDAQFTASIAIAQASPGPNVLFVAAMGYQAAGFAGVAATLIGIMLPSTTIAYAVTRWSHARQDWLGVRAFRAGMAPITIALMFGTGWVLTWPRLDATPTLATALLTVGAALAVWRTRVHLLALIATGALLGAFGWV